MNLSVSEVLDALAKASEIGDSPAHTYSGTEIMRRLHIGPTKFHPMMRKWLADGVCKVVTYHKPKLSGGIATVQGYQFVPSKKKR